MNKAFGLGSLTLIWILFTSHVMGVAFTGNIVIDGVEYGSGSSQVIVGNGQIATERRELACFDQIAIHATVDVVYHRGDTCEVRISADSNLIEFIESEIHGQTLTITAARSYQSTRLVKAEVVSPALESLEVLSTSNVELISLNARSFSLNVEGTGDIRAEGKVETLDVTARGTSTIDLTKLRAETAHIRISGTSDLHVFASDTLIVEIEGTGDVIYYGQPKTIRKRILGVGSVEMGH